MRETCHVLTLCCIAFAMCVTAQEAKPGGHEWAYDGAEGPSHWGDLNPEYETCKLGRRQSPIDIRAAQKAALPPIQFNYKASPLRIINNGHAIQINYAPGSFMFIGDKQYELQQFHFHHPSEEEVDGKAFDLAAHLVHSDAEGQLAVVAVLFTQGKANPTIEKLWQDLPSEEGKEQSIPGKTVDAAALLPRDTGYYTYEGSLTTPPCNEPVTWFVLKTPVQVSGEEVAAYSKIYPHNARQTQPLNGRKVLESE